MTVSVCTPVYNGERYIGDTIRSVLAQDYKDLELIVSDNCSTDATVEVVRGCADPRIRLVRNERNIGAIANWNRVRQLARGRYVKLLPADDVLYPDCLSTQVGVLDDAAHRTVALVCAKRDIVDEAGGLLWPARGLGGMTGPVSAREAIRRCVRAGANLMGEPAAVLVRADALARAGPFDDRLPYMIDFELWSRVLRHGDLYAVRRALCTFRVTSTSESVAVTAHQGAQARALLRRLRAEGAFGVTAADLALGLPRASLAPYLRRLAYLEVRRRRAMTRKRA
ncbi:MAG TPA: glycosyltransferase [Egibacteraceae bacterium]|nr:glycosyltransferase [Egibacteraceae bacterium]